MTDWEAIVRTEGGIVWRTVRRILGNDADADECYQETFLAAFRLSRDESVKHWRALLTKIGTARAIDRLRTRIRHRAREEAADWEQLAQTGLSPSAQVENDELSERLRGALAAIPTKHAQIFCLAHLDGWSYQQIAEELGASVDSVGVTLHRAKQNLSAFLLTTNEVSK